MQSKSIDKNANLPVINTLPREREREREIGIGTCHEYYYSFIINNTARMRNTVAFFIITIP